MTTILEFHRAMELMKARFTEPLVEIRMHPDDVEELKRVSKPMLGYANMPEPGQCQAIRFNGLTVIPDETAERLPNLKT